MAVDFAYSNRAPERGGRLLTTLGLIVPGVREVRAQGPAWAEEWAASNRSAVAASGPLWVALGDSLTQGIGATAFDRGWLGQLSHRLQPAWPHRLVNLSVTGARLADVIDTQVPALGRLTDLGQEPAVVTCVAGSNDLFSRRRRRHLVEDYDHLLTLLPRGSVVANLPNPTRPARALDALLRSAAADGRIRLADMRREGPQRWRGLLAGDYFHPNDRGYAAMADVFSGPVRAAAGLRPSPDRPLQAPAP